MLRLTQERERRLRLTLERERRRWSRAELARRARLNPATVGLIEAGRLQPYPVQLAKLAVALGLAKTEAPTLVEPACLSQAPPRDGGLQSEPGMTQRGR